MTLLYSILFVIGLFVGSFLGVLVERIPKNEGFIFGRSKCRTCTHALSWYDLIPLLSFLALLGVCRYCKTKISFFYPTIELTTGALFVLAAMHLGTHAIEFLYTLFILSSLIVIFFTDLKHKIIPNIIVYPAIAISIMYHLSSSNYQLLITNYLPAAVGAFLFFLLLFFVTQGKGMGFGDVQFSILLGLFLGFPGIVFAIYIAFLTGALVSMILVLGRHYSIKSAIPFGPFLIFGTLVMFFFREKIIELFPFL